eukprot:scpid28350/ scgid24918/ Coagulation factor X; Stuart factor; Virus-activating protease; Factor X light chain; Factor X heavy chain; Activated factor Xa heavy chain
MMRSSVACWQLCLVLAFAVFVSNGQSVVHVGCFKVRSTDFVLGQRAQSNAATPSRCVKACALLPTSGFALLANNECRCSPSLHTPIVSVSDARCDRVCGSGSRGYKCGSRSDDSLHSVYSIPAGPLREDSEAYLGCFEESSSGDSRIEEFEIQLTRSDTLNTQCVTHCEGRSMPFAAVSRQSSSSSGSLNNIFGIFASTIYCRCGRAYGSLRRVSDSKCPGASAGRPCQSFDCFISQYAEQGYYSVFTMVDHPPSVVHCGNPSPGAVDHAVTKIGVDHYHHDTVRYECKRGYHVRGHDCTVQNKTITCLGTGNWSSTPPDCVPCACDRLPTPPGVIAQQVGSTYGLMFVDSVISFTCPLGSELVVHGMFYGNVEYNVTCGVDGTWSGPPPQCRNETCRVPPPPENGIIHSTGKYMNAGESIFYSCQCGYRLKGSQQRNCSNGIFVPEEPNCERVICKPRFSPVNGKIEGNSSAVHYYGTWYPIWEAEEIAYYACDNGSKLVGSAFAVCFSSGTWSHPAPTCLSVEDTLVIRGLTEPEIEDSDAPSAELVARDRTFRMPCAVTGNPRPEVSWVRLDGGASPVDSDRAVQLADNTLMFFSFGSEDIGKYRCTATNGIGSSAAKTAVLQMSESPVIDAASPNVFHSLGSRAVMRCDIIRGSPPPVITWHFSGGTDNSHWRITGDSSFSELVIESVAHSDAGNYDCRATNQAGGHEVTNSSSISLHVESCTIGGSRAFIVGGHDIPIANASWQAMLWNNSAATRQNILCGAVIIRPGYLLTAAHCVQNITDEDGLVPSHYVMKMGKDRAREQVSDVTRAIQRVFIHPNYNPTTLDNDIALIALNSDINYIPGRVAAIDLARTQTNDLCNEQEDSILLLTGFGRKSFFRHTGTKNLKSIELPIVTQSDCAAAFPYPVTSNMICAGSGQGQRDACHGDSGGPAAAYNILTRKWTLIGLISWGDPRCATAGTYTVLVRVSRFEPWIKQTLRGHKKQLASCPP